MSDWPAGWTTDHRWLREILRNELMAFSDFCSSPQNADGQIGIGLMADSNPAVSWSSAADDRNGVARCTVPAAGTLRITAGPAGSAYGVTSAQRNPSMRIRWVPVQPGANLVSQRVGFVAVAAADVDSGVYLRSTTTGNLFFVGRSEAGAESANIDLGVSPSTLTEYRIYTNDGGNTWMLDREGAPIPGAVITASKPVVSTRLLPELRVVAGAGGSVVVDIDWMFFRAWKGTPPPFSTPLDRITARDIEKRMAQRAFLGWASFLTGASGAGTAISDYNITNINAAGAGSTGQNAESNIGVPAGVSIGGAYGGTGRFVVSPNQSPSIVGVLSWAGAAAANSGFVFGFTSAWGTLSPNGAFLRRDATGNLFFVTRQTAETITDLGAAPAAGVAQIYEVRSLDGGTTWQCLRDGAVVAQHTTNVPTKTTALLFGLSTLAAANANMGLLDIFAHCDRLR